MSRVVHLQHYVSKFLLYMNEKKKKQNKETLLLEVHFGVFFIMITLGLSAEISKIKLQISDLLKNILC